MTFLAMAALDVAVMHVFLSEKKRRSMKNKSDAGRLKMSSVAKEKKKRNDKEKFLQRSAFWRKTP